MEELEKCPYCGELMEQGYLIGARGIYWWPAGKPFPATFAHGESIAPSANMKFWKGLPNLRAHRCKRCQAILVRYP